VASPPAWRSIQASSTGRHQHGSHRPFSDRRERKPDLRFIAASNPRTGSRHAAQRGADGTDGRRGVLSPPTGSSVLRSTRVARPPPSSTSMGRRPRSQGAAVQRDSRRRIGVFEHPSSRRRSLVRPGCRDHLLLPSLREQRRNRCRVANQVCSALKSFSTTARGRRARAPPRRAASPHSAQVNER